MKTTDQMNWRAVYTKPRSEKKVAERLMQQGLEVYCPLQTILRQWSDRKKKVSVPVFPSYVFLRLAEYEATQVLQDPGVLNFVYWLGRPAKIKSAEIETIQAFLNNHQNTSFELISYKKGDEVDINTGPLKGHSGIVDMIRNDQAVMKIESLGLLIRVKLNVSQIAKSKPASCS